MASLAPSQDLAYPCRLSISTNSLGNCNAGHTLQHRLDEASKNGYEGVEIFYDDLLFMARSLPSVGGNQATGEIRGADILRAASCIGDMCTLHSLHVVCLQPLRHFEGLCDPGATTNRLRQLQELCEAAILLGTDLILIPSNFLTPDNLVGDDMEAIVHDLRAAADTAAEYTPRVRLCYEALAWGTYVDTWEKSWEIVQAVDRPNFGLCLDTFNIAARIYGDPTTATGKADDGQNRLTRSMAAMASLVDVNKVFLLQVADAEKLDDSIAPGHPFHEDGVPARMSWSRNCRLFFAESKFGGCLPISYILKTIFVELGYTGWVSFELFHRYLSDTDPRIPEIMAKRGAISWGKMVKEMGLYTGRLTLLEGLTGEEMKVMKKLKKRKEKMAKKENKKSEKELKEELRMKEQMEKEKKEMEKEKEELMPKSSNA